MLLAGLQDPSPPAEAPEDYCMSHVKDRRWWLRLKRQMGIPVSTPYHYTVHLPKQYDRDEGGRWPLFVFLHGGGIDVGSDFEEFDREGVNGFFAYSKPVPFVTVVPYCRGGLWDSDRLLELLDVIEVTYRIDSDRVYVGGHSMGAFATMHFARRFPDRLAAAVSISGGIELTEPSALAGLPVWAFHGTGDGAVPVAQTDAMVAALKAAGCPVTYTRWEGKGHGIEEQALTQTELYEWLLRQTRRPAAPVP